MIANALGDMPGGEALVGASTDGRRSGDAALITIYTWSTRLRSVTGPQHIGDYRLDGLLGRGGQGTVYLGQNSSGTKVAVKVLNSPMADDQDARRRFEREAEAARRVAPFCTARVFDAGIADDRPYIVSEFIAGPALDRLVEREGVRSGSGLERLAVATLTALAAIHRAGIVHRDFKPSNVIMGPEGPVVIDFGIARALDQTVTSRVIGTPAFMAPEQFEGGAVGPEVDLFSWAGTMVFAATGQYAFAGDTTPALMRAILDAEPDLTGVPVSLRPVLEKCLVKDPRRRPNAGEVLRWLTGERSPLTDDRQATTPLVEDAFPTFEPPSTQLHDEGAQAPGFGAPDPDPPPNMLLAIAASAIMIVAVLLGLMSMPVALNSDGLANISLGLLLLSTPVLGAAVWHHHTGAGIALCSTLPSGLVYAAWTIAPGSDWSFPAVLFVLVPIALQGAAIALTATFLRRMGTTATVLGVAGGTSLVVFAAGRTLVALPGVYLGESLFQLLMVVTAIGAVSVIAWLVLLDIALLRRTLQSRRPTP